MNTELEKSTSLLRDKQVAARLSCAKSTVWNLVKKGKLPPPIKLGEKWSVWRSTDIDAIISNPECLRG